MTELTHDICHTLTKNHVLNATDLGYGSVQSPFEEEVKRADMTGNQLTDVTPFLESSSLGMLNVARNKVKALPSVANTSLHILDLSENPLENLSGLERCTELKVLILARCKDIANPESMAAIASLQQLHTLILREVPLTTTLLKPIIKMKSLKKLVLSGCGLTELPWGSSVHHLSGLTELRLHGNSIRSLNIYMTACKELKILDLSQNPVSEECLETIAKLPKLTHLSLKGSVLAELGEAEYKKKTLGACRGKLKYLDNDFATEELKERKERKRGAAAEVREEHEAKRAKLAIYEDSAREAEKLSSIVRNTVVFVDPPVRTLTEQELHIEEREDDLFELKKLQNGSSADDRSCGLHRGSQWALSGVSLDTSGADAALAFLSK